MPERPSVSFHQLSMRPGDHPPNSVKILCIQETFRKLPSTFCAAGDFYQLLSTIHATGRTSVNFHQHFVQSGGLPSTSFKFHAAGRLSVNSCQLCVLPGDFTSTSVNFNAAERTSFNFRQLYMRPGDIPSTFVNFLCGRVTFRHLLSTFHAGVRPSVKSRQLPLTSVNF